MLYIHDSHSIILRVSATENRERLPTEELSALEFKDLNQLHLCLTRLKPARGPFLILSARGRLLLFLAVVKLNSAGLSSSHQQGQQD